MKDRIILHCDCNSFFASVESVSHPEYKSAPMAVCGDPDERHGIVLAKNELAKARGVQTAETIWSAKRKCPNLLVVKPHYEEYTKFYHKINEIYYRYTNIVEPFSIDESWLDVTGSTNLFGDGMTIAEEIRQSVKRELGITVSIGVSYNKVFAKMGSDYKKPDAITEITRENYKSLLHPLPVTELLFVGKSLAESLEKCNIRTIGDIARTSPDFLEKRFGKAGRTMHIYANGEDTSEVIPPEKAEDSKSVGNGMTFRRDISSDDDVRLGIDSLSEEVAVRLRRNGYKALGVSLTIKDVYLQQITRQCKLKNATDTAREISSEAYSLYKKNWQSGKAIRMLTVTATPLARAENVAEQIDFFDESKDRERTRQLELALDKIRDKFGKSSIRSGAVIGNDLGIDNYESHSKE